MALLRFIAMPYRMIKNKNIQGASFLEIMIAMLLSAIILSGIFRYSYYLENLLNVSALKLESIEKDNVLFASMVRDIEMAGYVGCVNASSRKNIIDDSHYLSSTWLIAHDDQLEAQYMATEQFLVMEKSSDSELLISGENHLKEDDVVFIENCWEAEVVKIKKIHSVNYGAQSGIEFYSPLKISHFEDAYIGKLIQHNYFIKNSSALYVRDPAGSSEEILENISSFSISASQGGYGIFINELNSSDPIFLSARAYNAS